MSDAQQWLRDHGVHEWRTHIRGRLSELAERTDFDGADTPADLAREAVPIVDAVGGYLGAVDPRLVPRDAVEALEKNFEQMDQRLDQLDAGVAGAHVSFENAITDLRKLVTPLAAVAPLSASSAEEAGRAIAERIDLPVEAFRQELTEAQQAVGTLNAEREKAEEEARDELVELSNEVRTELEAVKAAVEQEATGRSTEFSATLGELDSRMTELITDFDQRARAVVEAAEAKRVLVEQMYGEISDLGTSGAYGTEAQEQRGQADGWRYAAIAMGVVTAIAGTLSAILVSDRVGSRLVDHLGTLAVVVVLTGVTAYAAKQSGAHRQREERAKRLELELKAFGPFVDSMDDPSSVRAEYSERLFRGAGEVQPRRGDDNVTVAQTLGEALIEVLKRVTPSE
jgi:ElaB/YqjD/DUF883 family membrane-anchored ribosome-binding protein